MKKFLLTTLITFLIILLTSCDYHLNGFIPDNRLEEHGVPELQDQISFNTEFLYYTDGLTPTSYLYLNINSKEELDTLAQNLFNYFHDETKFAYCGYHATYEYSMFRGIDEAFISHDIADYYLRDYDDSYGFYLMFVFVPVGKSENSILTIISEDKAYNSKHYNTKLKIDDRGVEYIHNYHGGEYIVDAKMNFDSIEEIVEFCDGFEEFNNLDLIVPLEEKYFDCYSLEFCSERTPSTVVDGKRYDYQFKIPEFHFSFINNDSNGLTEYEIYYSAYTLLLNEDYKEQNIIVNENGFIKIGDTFVGKIEIKIYNSELNKDEILNEFLQLLNITLKQK